MSELLETAVFLLAATLFVWVLKREREINHSLQAKATRHSSIRETEDRRTTNQDQKNDAVLGESTSIDPFPLMELPAEIRRMVWKLCLPAARLIEADDDHCYSPDWKFGRPRRDLHLLHACYESRSVALEHYRPLRSGAAPRGYFDPARDIVHFTPGSRLFPGHIEEYAVFRSLRHIAVLAAASQAPRVKLSCLPLGMRGKTPLDELILFGGLETIYVVIEELARWAEVAPAEGCALVAIGREERGTDAGVWEAVEAFKEGLVALKEERGLRGIPAVVPVRCVLGRA